MEKRRESPEPPQETPGGPLWSELIKEALAEERSRKDSLERRGVAMLSASAFLSAFVLSLLALRSRTSASFHGSRLGPFGSRSVVSF
jgi:hypothetical protein